MSKTYEVLERCIYEGVVYLPGEKILMPDSEKPAGVLKLVEETKPAKKVKAESEEEVKEEK